MVLRKIERWFPVAFLPVFLWRHHLQPWAPIGFFAGGANPEASPLFKSISGYSVYLWNTNTCCFISLCRKETDSMSDLAMCKGVHLHLPSGAHVFGVDVLQRPSFFLSSEMRGSLIPAKIRSSTTRSASTGGPRVGGVVDSWRAEAF